VLHLISIWFLILSGVSALAIAVDLKIHPQKMWIMNVVWPITALYFGPLTFWSYFAFGRNAKDKPFWQQVWTGVTHCGAGCTLGDVIAEWSVFLGGLTLLSSPLLTDYLFDFCAAYALGIIFQYFSIAPMRSISGWPAIKAALKADTISLIAFEVGLFAFMYWMDRHFQPHLKPTQPEYWFLMQVGMIIGFFTAFPANWWLIRKGWKEAM
jgi:hypothetical protein